MNRPDAPLIRHLSKTHSPEVGTEYTRLPLFLIPDDLAVLAEQEADLLASIGEGEDRLHLPFADLLLDCPAGVHSAMRSLWPDWPLDRGQLYVRVRTLSEAIAAEDAQVFVAKRHLEQFSNPEEWALLETWESKTTVGSFHKFPDVSVVPLTSAARDFSAYWHAYPNQYHLEGRVAGIFCNLAKCTLDGEDVRRGFCAGSEIVMSTESRLVILALAYLSAGVSLTVRVRPESAEPLKPHVARDKPWLIAKPHYILIDPERLSDYGHPSAGDPIGTHRSPTPHARRGHWRRLPKGYRKERTWVRPAFIGETDWSSAGSRYKIVGK